MESFRTIHSWLQNRMPESFHSKVEEQFFEYLLTRRGYPRDAVAYEARLGESFRPDFAVTDPRLDQRLAYFEVKGQLIPGRKAQVFSQLKAYTNAAKTVGASVYLAVAANAPTVEEPFDFYYVDRNGSVQELPKELFPSYQSLSSEVLATRKEQIELSTETTKDDFQTVCWILAVVALILAVVDFICDQKSIELIDATRLTLFGITVALIVIPFSQKFKILGIEYERFIRKNSDKLDKS